MEWSQQMESSEDASRPIALPCGLSQSLWTHPSRHSRRAEQRPQSHFPQRGDAGTKREPEASDRITGPGPCSPWSNNSLRPSSKSRNLDCPAASHAAGSTSTVPYLAGSMAACAYKGMRGVVVRTGRADSIPRLVEPKLKCPVCAKLEHPVCGCRASAWQTGVGTASRPAEREDGLGRGGVTPHAAGSGSSRIASGLLPCRARSCAGGKASWNARGCRFPQGVSPALVKGRKGALRPSRGWLRERQVMRHCRWQTGASQWAGAVRGGQPPPPRSFLRHGDPIDSKGVGVNAGHRLDTHCSTLNRTFWPWRGAGSSSALSPDRFWQCEHVVRIYPSLFG